MLHRSVDEIVELAAKEYECIVRSEPRPAAHEGERMCRYPSATKYATYPKNRYPDVLPREGSRVRLHELPHRPGSDYINGNWVDGVGPNGRRRYIATQAPLPKTFEDFWRMVLEQDVAVIVMLTALVERGRTKADRYYPDGHAGRRMQFGPCSVTLLAQYDYRGITVRRLGVACQSLRREVVQLHFADWPDQGVPEHTMPLRTIAGLADYFSDMGRKQRLFGPLVVHCSAGLGRTGTFLAAHASLTLLANKKSVNVKACVARMREQREGMVQSVAQYTFVYRTIYESLRDGRMPRELVEPSMLHEPGSDPHLPMTLPPPPRAVAQAVDLALAYDDDGELAALRLTHSLTALPMLDGDDDDFGPPVDDLRKSQAPPRSLRRSRSPPQRPYSAQPAFERGFSPPRRPHSAAPDERDELRRSGRRALCTSSDRLAGPAEYASLTRSRSMSQMPIFAPADRHRIAHPMQRRSPPASSGSPRHRRPATPYPHSPPPLRHIASKNRQELLHHELMSGAM